MTALIPEFVRRTVESFTFDYRSATAGIILIVALIVFLIGREIVRVHGGPRVADRLEALNAFVYPMLVAFAAVIVVRLVSLI
jgi:multisubunit Na+/H+ antiporter MnhF subunit